MGREIRRVPADWEHPKEVKLDWKTGATKERYVPLFDSVFEDEAREWLDKAIAWDNGTDPDCAKHKATHPFYWQWSNNPPDPKAYRPRWPNGAATHYQVYETVSEGTPVTPHFATKEELIDHLVKHGDEWDHGRGWNRAAATDFVEREWAPSMIIADGVIMTPRDGMPKERP